MLLARAAAGVLLIGATACQENSPPDAEAVAKTPSVTTPPAARVPTKPLQRPARPRFASEDEYMDAIAQSRANVPRFDVTKQGDPAYQEQFRLENERARRETVDLMGEFCALYPDHGHVPVLLSERWKLMCTQLNAIDQATGEILMMLERGGLSVPADTTLRHNLFLAYLGSLGADFSAGKPRDPARLAQASAALDDFLERYPRDPGAARDLYDLARMYDGDDARQRELYAKLVAMFPNSRYTDTAAGWVRRVNSIGKPFDLFFEDAITGEQVDIVQYRGKVVLVSFWATWSPVCLAELEDHKQLLERYAGKLAIIGVSHDDSVARLGLAALQGVVAGQEVTWPQYHQGSKWKGEFSTTWGVNKIPMIFVIDAKGNLHSTDAHGRLTEAIEAALAEQSQ
jgi:thiol-disulfide isomerase/thioredoxin